MKHDVWKGLAVSLLLLTAYACGGSSSGGGGAATTTAPVTSASQTATVASLRITGLPLVSGDVPVAFKLVHPAGVTTDVAVTWSLDAGQSWSVATPASGSVTLTGLTTSPSPGVEHVFRWDTVADIPGFEPDVLLRVEALGGGALDSTRFAVDNQALSTHVTFNRLPYLQNTTVTETRIAWRTETSTGSVVEWGPTPALGQTAGNPQSNTREHWVTLSGLQPGTEYYYRIVDAGLPLTPRHQLQTAPDPAQAPSVDPVRFVVVGDSGMGNPEQHQIAALMAQEDAEFFLHTGDVVYPAGGFPAAIVEYNKRFFEPYQDMLSEVTAFPVVGNHDLYGLFGAPFKQTFDVPRNGSLIFEELYYAFDWGDCRFLAIESNTLFQKLGWGPHINWLENELRNNQRKWLIVYLHAPLYSARKHGDNQDLINRLGPLFERYKVDLVLAGHDHNYERSIPVKQFNQDPNYPGLVHIVTGGGGAALRPVTPTPRTHVAISAHHYMRFSIQGDWIHGEAVDINGQVIDSFRVQDQ
jgi:predicted phosphodiesterase